MKKVFKIKTSKTHYDLSEISQNVNLKFAWGNRQPDGSINLCHQFVKCKDFLHDIVWATVNKKETDDLFGLFYNPFENLPVTLYPSIYLVVQSDNSNNLLKMKVSKKILNTFEKLEGLKPSKLFTCDNDKMLLFKSPPDWASSTIMVSMYSYFIRAGVQIPDTFKDVEDIVTLLKCKTIGNDKEYAQDVGNNFINLFKNRKKFDFNTFNLEEWSNYNIHDNGGIVSAVNLWLPDYSKDFKTVIRSLVV